MKIASYISREDMADLPIRRFEGEIRMVSTAEDLEEALSDFRTETIVGLDTETRPAFRKGEVHLPCLLQAATARAVYIFQLARAEVFPVLREMLEDARVVKAGVALAHDLRMLSQVFPFEQNNIVELGTLARRAGLEQTGLRNLAGIFLGFRIPKGNRTSNWAARRLSPAQLNYAATDAWASRELYLKSGLVRLQGSS